MSDLDLIKAEAPEKIRLNSRPYIVLKLNGSSYLNKKAASLLDLKNGDVLAFYHTADFQKWFIANDESSGATILKNGGLYRFCDTKIIKQIFKSYGIEGNKKAFFPTAGQIEIIGDKKTLFIIPNPFNVD